METSITEPISECIFCSIAAGSAPTDVVHDGGDTLFFRDIAPKAAIHILGIPKQHISSLAAVTASHQVVLGKLIQEAASVAAAAALTTDGYRLILNVGANAGQEVAHLHLHILGGEPLGPMRC